MLVDLLNAVKKWLGNETILFINWFYKVLVKHTHHKLCEW